MVTIGANQNLEKIKEEVLAFAERMKDRELVILGHDNIDVDAVLSGILLSKLFNYLKIKNHFYILESVKEGETYNIVKGLFEIDMKQFEKIGENEKRLLFLEDHFETVHAGKIIGCIDHHPTSREVKYDFMYKRNSCAAAYLIYEIMQLVGYKPSAEEAKMIIVSMMVDTTSFKSSKTIMEEVDVAKKLAHEYELDYDYLIKYCLCLTPIDKMTVEEIITNGQKYYDYYGYKVSSAYLQLYEKPSDSIVNDVWIKALREKIKECHLEMYVFIIFEMEKDKTYEIRVTENGVKKFEYPKILSRGKDIMPVVEKVFAN